MRNGVAHEAPPAVHVRQAPDAGVRCSIAEWPPRRAIEVVGAFHALSRGRVAHALGVARPAVGVRLAAHTHVSGFAAARLRVRAIAAVGARKDALFRGRLADLVAGAVPVDAALNATMQREIAAGQAGLGALQAVGARDALAEHAVAMEGAENAVLVASTNERSIRRKAGVAPRVAAALLARAASVGSKARVDVSGAGVDAVDLERPLLRATASERQQNAQHGRAPRHGTAPEIVSASA